MNVRLQYTMQFTAGVYYEKQLRMNNYTLTVYMMTNSTDANDHDVSFERIKYFVYNQMDSTIFINDQEKSQCQRYVDAGLDVTTLPGDPVDQLIGIMLYYKLNAISEDRMTILETEISSQMGSHMVYIHGENENIGNISFPDWWQSADLVHCDHNLISVDKIVNLNRSITWRDLELNWSDIGNNTPEDNTVVFADFTKDETK
jgi:hypothetical protein